MAGDIRDRREIELRQQPLLPGSVLELRRNQSLRDQRPGGAEPIQHVERRRMKGRGAQLLAEIGAGLEHRHRDAARAGDWQRR